MTQPTSAQGTKQLSSLMAAILALVLVLGGVLALAPATATAAPKPKPQCADRIDNDLDGAVDHSPKGGDPDCESRKDTTETDAFECVDLDGDGLRDTPPAVPHASANCNFTTGEVHLRECDRDFHDLDGILENGCEYGPVPFTGPEQCDGLDNDADGVIDEQLPPFPAVANGELACNQGAVVVVCAPGFADSNGDIDDGCEDAVVALGSQPSASG